MARLFPVLLRLHYGPAGRNAAMSAWQSGYKVRREHGNLPKTFGCHFGHFYDNNLARNMEQAKGESWNQFVERHGDWGRDAALWLGRHAGRLRLAQLGRLVGNLDYAVVSKTVARFERRLRSDPQLRDQLARVQLQLSK